MEQNFTREGRVVRALHGLVGVGLMALSSAGCGGFPGSGTGGTVIPPEQVCVTTDAAGISHINFDLSCAGAESRPCTFLIQSSNSFISILRPGPPVFVVPINTTRRVTIDLRASQLGVTDLSALVGGPNSRLEPIARVTVARGC